MQPEQVVRDFCQAFSRQDLQEILGYFAEDAVYHNIPMAPAEGLAAIEAVLKQFVDPSATAEFEIRHLAVAGNAVLTERLDRLSIGGKPVELPVMGTFEVGADGKITAWRDYFDMAQLTSQMS
jgi:limonene-1,2-epoxide hydrolase